MPSHSTSALEDVVRQIKSYNDAHTSLDVSELFGFDKIDLLQDETIDNELNAMVDALNDNPNLAIEEFVLRYPQYKVGEQGIIALAVLFLQNVTIKSIILDNVRFVCSVYNVPYRETAAYIEDFTELGKQLRVPVRFYSSGMRMRLAFALSLAIDFDCFLMSYSQMLVTAGPVRRRLGADGSP